jgi:hypothetical protein
VAVEKFLLEGGVYASFDTSAKHVILEQGEDTVVLIPETVQDLMYWIQDYFDIEIRRDS